MLNFYFLEKDLGIVTPTHFEYDFLRKLFLILSLLHTCGARVEVKADAEATECECM